MKDIYVVGEKWLEFVVFIVLDVISNYCISPSLHKTSGMIVIELRLKMAKVTFGEQKNATFFYYVTIFISNRTLDVKIVT